MADLGSAEFQRAFAAVSYLAGRRNDELLGAFKTQNPEARAFAQRLGHPERERRAEVLARELARVVSSLEARKLK